MCKVGFIFSFVFFKKCVDIVNAYNNAIYQCVPTINSIISIIHIICAMIKPPCKIDIGIKFCSICVRLFSLNVK